MIADGVILNLIRVGKISTLNKTQGTLRALFDDKDNLISDELPIMANVDLNTLNIGDQVVCIFLPNGIESGFCIGKFYSEINPPGGSA
ncbi:hypothetical protein [Clostridium magnum]|uniref:Uncharacterized protein n=1 Tax=Clostridium magnum DSM 2767 TaxID=1121326 RepID=A0A161W0R2_9CLOT|nr:hypothetical protein [Clostridium magnum]KZL88720.1 hypothetical protein CLMAG_60090 [Clostridium magnum DSM 2767]SHJ43892.1 hypothetical protein SAMN02745944_05961 [Clostridium magnum DSM 2767]